MFTCDSCILLLAFLTIFAWKYKEIKGKTWETEQGLWFYNGNWSLCIEKKSNNTEVSKASFLRIICTSYLNENACS